MQTMRTGTLVVFGCQMHEALLFHAVPSGLRWADGASKGAPVLDSDDFIV